MKKRYYFITAISAYLILLLATIPASMLSSMLPANSPLQLSGVSGSLWQGEAIQIRSRLAGGNTITLNRTRWSFAPLQLFRGRLAFDIRTRLQDNKLRARAGSSLLGRFFIDDLHATLPASEVTELIAIPLAQLGGLFDINIDSANWKQGETPQVNGRIDWKNASISIAETAQLGNISIELAESDDAALLASIANQGGDIKISGSAKLLPENRYQTDIRLKPLAGASDNIRQSLAMFARPQAGEYVLKSSGSLTQTGFF